jgi:hypothetical protein
VCDGQPLPADLGVGDYLAVGCAGAYSTSFGSNTNGFQPAAVVMHWADGGRLAWEVSPLGDLNGAIPDRVRAWATGARNQGDNA